LWKRVLFSGLVRDRKDGVMCKVDIIDYQWVVHFEEVKERKVRREKGRRRDGKRREKNWSRERKVGQLRSGKLADLLC
jgi:hypothetical protein